MTIGQLLCRMDLRSTINRVYIYRNENLVEWFEKENIRCNCYLGWSDKEINSFEICGDALRISLN